MKNYLIKFEHEGKIYFVMEKAFTFNGAYRKVMKRYKKN